MVLWLNDISIRVELSNSLGGLFNPMRLQYELQIALKPYGHETYSHAQDPQDYKLSL